MLHRSLNSVAGSIEADRPAIQRLLRAALDDIARQSIALDDGTIFVKGGDIPGGWHRDTHTTIRPLLFFAKDNSEIQKYFKAVLEQSARNILLDPYANAFTIDLTRKPTYPWEPDTPGVWERKYEIDSHAYVVLSAWTYWRVTNDKSVFTPTIRKAFETVLETMVTESHHNEDSKYRFESNTEKAGRNPVGHTGMIWSGFRPSDDACVYNYPIASEMMVVQALTALAEIEQSIVRDAVAAAKADDLGRNVHAGIQKHGIVPGPDGTPVFACEVDGLGHYLLMDDAGPPNLLYNFGYAIAGNEIYDATRRFILSPRNPYFYESTGFPGLKGLGSAHTPRSYIWPLGLLSEGLTTDDPAEHRVIADSLEKVLEVQNRSDLIEAFCANDPRVYTRESFPWPNSLFFEFWLTKFLGYPPLPVPASPIS